MTIHKSKTVQYESLNLQSVLYINKQLLNDIVAFITL